MTVKKKKAEIKRDTFFQVFCGEAISVMLDRDVEQTKQTETQMESLKTSISVQGYLIEMDDDFLYLGYEPEMINQAVKISSIVHVETMENPLDEIMNSMEVPKDGGFN
jgi:hypothetical protein